MLHIIARYVIKGALRWYTDGETDDEVTSHDVHETPTVDDKARRDKADHTVFIPRRDCESSTEGGPIVFTYVLFLGRKRILDFQILSW